MGTTYLVMREQGYREVVLQALWVEDTKSLEKKVLDFLVEELLVLEEVVVGHRA